MRIIRMYEPSGSLGYWHFPGTVNQNHIKMTETRWRKKWTKAERKELKAMVAEKGMAQAVLDFSAKTGRTVSAVKNVWGRMSRRKPYTRKTTTNPGLLSQTVKGGSILDYIEARVTPDSEFTFKTDGTLVGIKF